MNRFVNHCTKIHVHQLKWKEFCLGYECKNMSNLFLYINLKIYTVEKNCFLKDYIHIVIGITWLIEIHFSFKQISTSSTDFKQIFLKVFSYELLVIDFIFQDPPTHTHTRKIWRVLYIVLFSFSLICIKLILLCSLVPFFHAVIFLSFSLYLSDIKLLSKIK